MPEDLKHETTAEGKSSYYSKEEDLRIEVNSLVRIKIIGIRLAADQMAVIGTIKEDFLGACALHCVDAEFCLAQDELVLVWAH